MKAPTETATVQSPAELALVEAYAIQADAAVEAASALAATATERLERQGLELATTGRFVELRTMLVDRFQKVQIHNYLAALSLGEEPDPLPEPDVDAELVVRYTRARPDAFAQLVKRCEAVASSADARDATSGTRLAMLRDEFRAGVLDLGRFLEAFSRELGERAKHQQNANRYRTAAQNARAALRANIDPALGDLTALRSGLRECLALSRQTDQEVSRLAAELESVNSDLMRLGLDLEDDQAEPGPIRAMLIERRDSLANQIKSRKQQTIAQTGSSAGEIVDQARAGDVQAMAQIIGIVRQKPLAFDAGLADRIVEVMADGLSEAADVFAELVLT